MMPAHFADSPEMEAIYKMLSVTQPPPAPEVLAKQYRPASVVDKAHINGRYCTVRSPRCETAEKLRQQHTERSINKPMSDTNAPPRNDIILLTVEEQRPHVLLKCNTQCLSKSFSCNINTCSEDLR